MGRTRPSYPDEFRPEAVALVRSDSERTIPQIAESLGVCDQTLRNRVR